MTKTLKQIIVLLLLLNIQNTFFATALHDACKAGDLTKTQTLVEKENFDINKLDQERNTPLHMAVGNKHLKLVEYLLGLEDIDLTIINNNGDAAFDIAYKYKYREIVVHFFEKKGEQIFTHACQMMHPIAIASEIAAYAQKSQYKRTIKPVKSYVFRQRKKRKQRKESGLPIIRDLVENSKFKFDITQRFTSEDHPIDIACKYGDKNIILYLAKKLEERGINLTRMVLDTEIIFDACKRGKLATIKHLIETLGYPVTIKEPFNENTLLHTACAHGQRTIVIYLLDKGAKIETYNKKGNSPLCLAYANGHKHVIRVILKTKGDLVNKHDKTGLRMPLQNARSLTHVTLGLSAPAAITTRKYIQKCIQKEKVAHYKCAYQQCPGPKLFRDKEFVAGTFDGRFHWECLRKATIPQKSRDFAYSSEFQKLPIQKLIRLEDHVQEKELEKIGYSQEEIESIDWE